MQHSTWVRQDQLASTYPWHPMWFSKEWLAIVHDVLWYRIACGFQKSSLLQCYFRYFDILHRSKLFEKGGTHIYSSIPFHAPSLCKKWQYQILKEKNPTSLKTPKRHCFSTKTQKRQNNVDINHKSLWLLYLFNRIVSIGTTTALLTGAVVTQPGRETAFQLQSRWFSTHMRASCFGRRRPQITTHCITDIFHSKG